MITLRREMLTWMDATGTYNSLKDQDPIATTLKDPQAVKKSQKKGGKTPKRSKQNITLGIGGDSFVINIRKDGTNDQTDGYAQIRVPQLKDIQKGEVGGYELDNLMVRDQDYRSIPNNFKTKEGVAFPNTETKIKLNAGLAGIFNMGNTCFLSTAVQCLSAVQPLSDFFIGDLHEHTINKTNPMGTGGEITGHFANVIKEIWKGKEDRLYPAKFLKCLSEHAPHLVCGQQQDAQEFLAYLLDCLHEDLNRADKFSNLKKQKEQERSKKMIKPKEDQEDFSRYTEEQQEMLAYEAWKEHLHNNRSIIVDLFQGQLKSTLKCLNCHHTSIKFDSFMYLSVPIPARTQGQYPTLEECVEEFTKEEILDDENKWKCPKCKNVQRATKKIDIWKLPSILIVHLKRFEIDERKRSGKIRSYVDFPLSDLDLTPYVSKLQREKPIYDLFAVANHEGYLGAGHYYAYTKHRNNHLWYSFDDDSVYKIKREEEVVSAEAYILFYSKMTVDEFARQTLSEPGLWPHILNKKRSFANLERVKAPLASQVEKSTPQRTPLNIKFNQHTTLGLSGVPSKPFETLDPSKKYQSSTINSMEPWYDSNTDTKRPTVLMMSAYKSPNQQDAKYDYGFKNNNNDDYNSNSNFKRPSMGARAGQMIMDSASSISSKNRQLVINNNNNNYFINLYMKEGQF